jgi:hypothetical protein
VICDCLYYGGCYDQLNLPTLIMAEVLFRRLQAIVEAYSNNTGKPDWSMAKFLVGEKVCFDGIPPDLRQFAAKNAKEEREMQVSRTTAQKAMVDGGLRTEDSGADGSRCRGRGRGNGRGRGLAPAAS